MGAVPRKADVPATFAAEFDCARRCQTEFDLTGVGVRFTLGMMLAYCERAHEAAHDASERVYRYEDAILVRAAVLEPQAVAA